MFDEALKKTEEDITGEICWGYNYDNFSAEETAYVNGVEDTQGLFKDIITDLKTNYAPTIKMTKAEYDEFAFYRFAKHASVPAIMFFDALIKLRDYKGLFTTLSEEDIMRAWLFPETISIIKETD